MFEPTHDADAASILFNLPGYRVRSVDGHRVVLIEAVAAEDGCPSCGVLSARVQARPVQQVKDVTCGGEPVTVRVRKRRYVCVEDLCARRTFTRSPRSCRPA